MDPILHSDTIPGEAESASLSEYRLPVSSKRVNELVEPGDILLSILLFSFFDQPVE